MTTSIIDELETMTVYRETSVGWDERSLTNEPVNEDGDYFIDRPGFAAGDPRSPKRRNYEDPEVKDLRDYLQEHTGIKGLEICSPDEIDRARRIFFRDGFVVVRDLLDSEQLERFREGCARVLKEILSVPGKAGRKYMTETNRLPHRYSYGTSSASRQLLHDSVWASMIDLPTTTPLLKAIFGSSDYLVGGAGGDLCLPGAIEYQRLHSDLADSLKLTEGRLAQAEALGIELRKDEDTGELDLPTRRLIAEHTPPVVTINFVMSDLTWENGPIRQIPGTHASQQNPPTPKEEPEWMRLSTLVGASAGAGVFRDNRAWHGATPNVGHEVRALPNVEYLAPWSGGPDMAKTMPHEVWETLSAHAQHLCRHVKAEPGVWPAGAGVMHPLAAGRARAKQSAK